MNRLVKKKFLKEIEKLPEDHLREVRNYVDGLLKAKKKAKETKPDPKNDPILELIGIGDVEPFGHNIDGELYGD